MNPVPRFASPRQTRHKIGGRIEEDERRVGQGRPVVQNAVQSSGADHVRNAATRVVGQPGQRPKGHSGPSPAEGLEP
jgi:hypothetical protein